MTITPPKTQLPKETNPSSVKTDVERKPEPSPNHSQKPVYERIIVEEKKPTLHSSRKEVNKRGRVGEFRKEALLRQIPIGLQRDEYRETVCFRFGWISPLGKTYSKRSDFGDSSCWTSERRCK